jgi:hypothetical protein
LSFPELKVESGDVANALKSLGASDDVLNEWRVLVSQEFKSSDDDEEFS